MGSQRASYSRQQGNAEWGCCEYVLSRHLPPLTGIDLLYSSSFILANREFHSPEDTEGERFRAAKDFRHRRHLAHGGELRCGGRRDVTQDEDEQYIYSGVDCKTEGSEATGTIDGASHWHDVLCESSVWRVLIEVRAWYDGDPKISFIQARIYGRQVLDVS